MFELLGDMSLTVLSGPERDDASHGIVGRHTDRHAITRHNLDAESTHPSTQLRQDFLAGIALHAIESPTVYRNNSSLNINQIVFAQSKLPKQ